MLFKLVRMVMPIYCELVLTVLVNWRRDTSLEGKMSCFASASCGQVAGWLGLKAATSRRPSPPCTLSPSLNQFQCLVLRFPWWLRRQRIACNAGDRVRSLGWEDSPGEENSHPLRYSGPKDPTDCIVSPWGCKELDTTERLALKIQQLQGARGQMGKKGGGFLLREVGLGMEVMKRGTRRRGVGSQDPGKRGHNA